MDGGCALKRNKFTSRRIAFALKQAEVAPPVEEARSNPGSLPPPDPQDP